LTELVIPLDNKKMLAELLHQVTDVSRFEVVWFLAVNAEHLQGILGNTVQVDRKVVRISRVGSIKDEILKDLLIFNKLL
jgi:hypothetical protein